MNMLLHGISHANVRQGDTLLDPQHKDESNELKRFDRVLANPPFSQNYQRYSSKEEEGKTKKVKVPYPGRFHVWMPEKGKKADLMFVQHMLAVLKADGKLATVMPHGVLFRGGEEREARKYFISKGYLEAVIGLPSNLFYGTGIPACIFVMNKKGAADRKHVLFINADREYREGKAQNFLRPEDIDKIVHAYRRGKDVPSYARLVPVSEIEEEDYNCNIRRYVDNTPPPEPHDVRAHLHGGIPIVEINALDHFWKNYKGLKEDCFVDRDETYADLSEALKDKRAIAEVITNHSGVVTRQNTFIKNLEKWWQQNLPIVEALAPDPKNRSGKTGNVYVMRRQLIRSIAETFSKQDLLTGYQIRGAFANYVNELKADFKSIAASGWGPELIPDEDILQSQFPEVLEELDRAQTRLAELQALFAAADEEDFEDIDETGVLPGSEVRTLKDELKDLTAEWKDALKTLKAAASDLFTEIKITGHLPRDNKKSYYCTEGLGQKDPVFENGQRILDLADEVNLKSEFANTIKESIEQGALAKSRAESVERTLARHKALEDEVKSLRTAIKGTESRRDELVEKAREKISNDEARTVIIERLRKVLMNTYRAYLRADQRACVAAIENLWNKYAVTAKEIEAERDAASEQLKEFMVELGYE